MGLAEKSKEFERLGARLFALAIAPRGELVDLQESLGESLVLLADPDGSATHAFGMSDPEAFPKGPLARAGSFLIDARGVVRKRWLPDNYRERPEPAAILAALKELP